MMNEYLIFLTAFYFLKKDLLPGIGSDGCGKFCCIRSGYAGLVAGT